MGNLKGVDLTKGKIGPSNAGPDTSPSAIISNAPAVADTLLVNTVYEIKTVKQAEELGITPAYDIANDVVLHRHIVDFYHMAGEGVSLRMMVCNAADPATALTDANAIYAKKLITSVGAGSPSIWQIGVSWNMAPNAAAEASTDGMNSLIRAAIPTAQLFAEWAFATDRPCHVFLEGRRLSDALGGVLNLRNIQVGGVQLDAPKVSLVVGQDWDYAEARKNDAGADPDTKVQYYASVGKALGTVAAADMNQSIAEVATFNLSDAKLGYFLTAGLSNHIKTADQEADLQSLEDKGYIFPILFPTVSGYRWNNDHTCVEIVIDEEGNINEHMIYYSRTLDNAAMRLKTRFLQLVKSKVLVSPDTGQLTTTVLKNYEAVGDLNVFAKMAGQGFIVAGKTFVDPNSDLVTPPKSLLVSFNVVPTAILDNVAGTINLTKTIQI